jgi:hypothetical protein
MSIQLNQRVKDLEREVSSLKGLVQALHAQFLSRAVPVGDPFFAVPPTVIAGFHAPEPMKPGRGTITLKGRAA